MILNLIIIIMVACFGVAAIMPFSGGLIEQ